MTRKLVDAFFVSQIKIAKFTAYMLAVDDVTLPLMQT